MKLIHISGKYVLLCTYDERMTAKNAGFRWDATFKHWYTQEADKALRLIELADVDCRSRLVDLRTNLQQAVAASKADSTDFRFEGMRTEPRPFQWAGIEYGVRNKSIIIGDEMGLGKSCQALGIVQHLNAFPFLVVCPATLKINWMREAVKFLPINEGEIMQLSGTKPEPLLMSFAKMIIINYDVLIHRATAEEKRAAALEASRTGQKVKKGPAAGAWVQALREMGFKAVILDESHNCFRWNTAVLTNHGWLLIRDIVNSRLPVYVLSCNLDSHALEWKKVVGLWRNRLGGRGLVRVTHEFGFFICTPEHKVWTADGYVEASSLASGACLQTVPDHVSYSEEGKFHRTVLRTSLRQYIHEHQASDAPENIRGTATSGGRKSLPAMPENLLHKVGREIVRASKVLQSLVRVGIWDVPARKERSGAGRSATGSAEKTWIKRRFCEYPNDAQQSHAQPGDAAEDGSQQIGENISEPWRKREANRTAEGSIKCTRSADGGSHSNRSSEAFIQISTELVQGGLGRRGPDACHRSGWPKPQTSQVEVLGQKKDGCFECSRVVSVEVYQPTSDDGHAFRGEEDQFVYDLEVEDNHNYFAEGVLVSNCSGKSKRTAAVKELTKDMPIKLLLTGTPMVNKPVDLVPQLEILGRINEFGSSWAFMQRYCAPIRTNFGYDFTGSSHLEELQKKLRAGIMIRRLKKDVLKELPAKQRQVIEVPSDEFHNLINQENAAWDAYEVGLAEMRVALELAKACDSDDEYHSAVERLKEGQTAAFQEVAKLRHQTALAKVPMMIDHLKSAVEGQKVVVAAHHHDVIDAIVKEFGDKCVKLDGRDDLKERQASVDAFQNNPNIRLFVGQMRAAGVGITLTASSLVVFAEQDWTPSKVSQFEDRCHRIGQVDSVMVQHFVLERSLDARMAKVTVEKQQVFDRALDKEEAAHQLEMPISLDAAPATASASRKKIALDAEKIPDDLRTMIHQCLKMLAGTDGDFARIRNDVGFSKFDVHIGHSLAGQATLSPKQAAIGLRLCIKYGRQLPKEIVDRCKEITKGEEE